MTAAAQAPTPDRPRVVLTQTNGPRRLRRAEVSLGPYSAYATGATDRDALAALYSRLRTMLAAVEDAGKLAARIDAVPDPRPRAPVAADRRGKRGA